MTKNKITQNSILQKPILKISKLHKRYNEGKSNEVHALQGVDLTVKEGDMMAIMGPSGCGKTTLLNMIGNLDRRSTGEIVINDVDTSTLSDAQMTGFRRDNIGFIFQLFNLFPFLTAVENVETPLLLRGDQLRTRKRTSKNATQRTRNGRQTIPSAHRTIWRSTTKSSRRQSPNQRPRNHSRR